MAVLTKCKSFADAEKILGNRKRKKIGHNTYLQRDDTCIEAIYHETAVVTYWPDGKMTASTGGWHTVTTKDRLHQLLPARVGSTKGIWYINNTRFFDGIELSQTGEILNPMPEYRQDEIDAYNKKMNRQIKSYLDGYLNTLTLTGIPMPSGGDCWYCLGMLESDSHLLDHFEESYYVPSLAVNALRESGYQDAAIYWFLDMQPESNVMGRRPTDHGTRVHTTGIRRAMRKYLQKRLIKRP